MWRVFVWYCLLCWGWWWWMMCVYYWFWMYWRINLWVWCVWMVFFEVFVVMMRWDWWFVCVMCWCDVWWYWWCWILYDCCVCLYVLFVFLEIDCCFVEVMSVDWWVWFDGWFLFGVMNFCGDVGDDVRLWSVCCCFVWLLLLVVYWWRWCCVGCVCGDFCGEGCCLMMMLGWVVMLWCFVLLWCLWMFGWVRSVLGEVRLGWWMYLCLWSCVGWLRWMMIFVLKGGVEFVWWRRWGTTAMATARFGMLCLVVEWWWVRMGGCGFEWGVVWCCGLMMIWFGWCNLLMFVVLFFFFFDEIRYFLTRFFRIC